MRAFTNIELIASRVKWGKRIAPLTMLFLGGGLITNFMSFSQPEYFQLTIILLAIGFVLSIISSTLVNHWVREPRADQALTTALKKFGNDFLLFNYTSVVPHILLTPSRLYVIIVRRQNDEVRVKGQRFSRQFSFMRLLRFFVDEGLGLPVNEAQSQEKKLRKLLDDHFVEGQTPPEISSLVVFVSKDVKLIREEPLIPVLTTTELKTYLRENDKTKLIPATTRNQLINILGQGYQETKGK